MDLRAKTVKLTKLFVRSFLLRLKYGTKKSGWRLGDYRLLVLHSFRLNCPPLLSSPASGKLTQGQAHAQSPLVRCPSIAEPIGFITFFTFSTRLRFGIASDTAVFL